MKRYVLISLLVSVSLQATTIYVNAKNKTKDVNGLTWTTAYKSLNKALDTAKSGDDIWVAKGEYIVKPTRLEGVNIYGGFSATESALDERNITNNETKVFGRLALQNSLISSVTMLDKPENKPWRSRSDVSGEAALNSRVINLRIGEKPKTFQPNKKKMREQRDKRNRASEKWNQSHPDEKPLVIETEVSSEEKTRPDQGENKPSRENTHKRMKPKEAFRNFDFNADGKISKDEAPYPMIKDWERLDKNKDGFIDESELRPPRRRDDNGRPPRR